MALHPFSQLANYMLLGAVNGIKKDLWAGAKMNEPDYLAAIVTKFPILMNTMWGNVKFGGCYIHQKPYVTTKVGGNICEAGDLLVLCRRTVENETRMNAALFQLKRAKHPYEPVQPDNKKQYDLYTRWPEFSIGRKFNSAMSRDIEPKAVTPGAQYMFINDFGLTFYEYDCIGCCSDCPTLFTHTIPYPVMPNRRDHSFGRFLWCFIHWQTGRPIAPHEDLANDGWSRLIWDLIVRTKYAKISNINVGIQKKHNISRQQGDFFHFMTTDDCISHLPKSYFSMHNEDDARRTQVSDGYDEELEGAISILFIDID